MSRTFRSQDIRDRNWYYKTHPKRDWVNMYLNREYRLCQGRLKLGNRCLRKSVLINNWDDIVPSALNEPLFNMENNRKRKIREKERRRRWVYLQKEKAYDLMNTKDII